MATPVGLYSSLPRDQRGNQIRIVELLRADALQAGDVFHFDKCVEINSDGRPINLTVDAKAIVRAPDKAAVRGPVTTIDFDILENGQRTLLGAFTGPKLLAEALARKKGALRQKTSVSGLSQAWEDFQVWRNGRCLGTAADVRNHYYVNRKVGLAPRTRVTRDVTLVDVNAAASNPSAIDVAQNADVAPHTALAGCASPPALIPPATTARDFSNTLSSGHLAPREQRPQSAPSDLHVASPEWPLQLSNALRTVTNSARQYPKASDAQLEDTVMRELFNAIPASHQPEQYNKKYTAIYARRYIGFLQRRAGQAFRMIRVMGVTQESLVKMVEQMDEGLDVAAVMRSGLEWDEEEAPLGSPLGRYDPASQKFDVEMEDAE